MFYKWKQRYEEGGLEGLKDRSKLLDGVVIDDIKLFNDKLLEWENFYNYARPHGALGGQTPYDRLKQKSTATV